MGVKIATWNVNGIRAIEKKGFLEWFGACDADVIALQEVDNLEVLRRFRSDFLRNMHYDQAMLVDGNDPRHIDVAVLSRLPIVHVRSYHHLRSGQSVALLYLDFLVNVVGLDAGLAGVAIGAG